MRRLEDVGMEQTRDTAGLRARVAVEELAAAQRAEAPGNGLWGCRFLVARPGDLSAGLCSPDLSLLAGLFIIFFTVAGFVTRFLTFRAQ